MEGMLKIDKQLTAFDDLFIGVLMNRILVDVVTQSAKTNMNVEDVFFTIARDIKQRLAETDSKPEVIPHETTWNVICILVWTIIHGRHICLLYCH